MFADIMRGNPGVTGETRARRIRYALACHPRIKRSRGAPGCALGLAGVDAIRIGRCPSLGIQ